MLLYNVNDIFIQRKSSYGNGFEEYIFRSIPNSVVVFDINGNITSISNDTFIAKMALSASYSNTSTSSSYANLSSYAINSTYATTASYALNGGGSSIVTGSTLPITTSWSINSLNANTASIALTSNVANNLNSNNYYYVNGINSVMGNFTNVSITNLTTSAIIQGTASYSSTSSYALNGGLNIITGSTLPITSSVSINGATASYIPFNGNRSITRNGYSGINVGGNDVDDFLNNFFFPFLPATVSVSGGGLYATGSVQTVSVYSNITVNNETLFGTASVFKDSVLWNTDNTIPPYTFTFNDSNVTSNHSYETFVQTNNNGSPTIINSNTTSISFVYPYLYGMSTISGLSGSALYNAFTPQIINKSNQNINLNGSAVYIYFAYPSTYPNLTSILDPNSFQIIGSFNVSTALVTSTGLTNNWSVPYTIYQTQLVASPAGTFQFIY